MRRLRLYDVEVGIRYEETWVLWVGGGIVGWRGYLALMSNLEQRSEALPIDTVGLMMLLAAQHIEDHGWCRKRRQHDDAVCLLGALDKVGMHGYMRREAKRRIRKLLGSIVLWNNCTCQSRSEAVTALRLAAGAYTVEREP